ncbi:hypothetical protein [Saccharothrix yanglingensis]|uniref:Uncharacterized protein n=1 Tax=Saccharothrix yanglingensis TaxID=659496 RepID=A0ABU0X571_9PSEU|nr:hypothetical protein [Saccharothrix yanglingensis]MDQ2586757.1 hypothetical protein [Saccharothrix yanglingensis]
MVASPFVLGYRARGHAPEAIGNDVVVGLLVFVPAVAGALAAYCGPRVRGTPP